MIRNAITDFVQYRQTVMIHQQEDAERWIFEDGDGILTFGWCCEALGVHPDTVRRAALLIEDQPELLNSARFMNNWNEP